jgi:hypothetical protein
VSDVRPPDGSPPPQEPGAAGGPAPAAAPVSPGALAWQRFAQTLHAQGLIAEPALPPRGEGTTPWPVRVASGTGAWLASLLVLGSVGAVLGPLMNTAGGRGVVGALLTVVVAAWMRSRIDPASGRLREGAFAGQLGLAFALVGAALLASSLVEVRVPDVARCLLGAALALVLWAANPEPAFRFLAACAAVLALWAAGMLMRIEPLVTWGLAAACAALWLTQARWAAAGRLAAVEPFAWAVSLALLGSQLMDLGMRELGSTSLGRELHIAGPALRSIGLGAVLAASTWVAHRRISGTPRPLAGVLIVAGALAFAAIAWRTPGVGASLIAWVVGVAAGRALLQSLALCALAGYLYALYWSMAATLMDKGLAMLASGVVLAGLAGAVHLLRRRAVR